MNYPILISEIDTMIKHQLDDIERLKRLKMCLERAEQMEEVNEHLRSNFK